MKIPPQLSIMPTRKYKNLWKINAFWDNPMIQMTGKSNTLGGNASF
jgi:hypothetical protein